MPHELPPHFHQIKADEARFFAEKSQHEDSLDLRLRVTKLEQALKFASIEIAELRHQIRETLMENLHLADGDDCTLKRLKDAISFDLEDSCENEEHVRP
jgi:regulator of replication initiation timing